MGGMGTSLQTTNPTIVSAFESALLHQALVVLVILALLAVAWNLLRSRQLRRATSGSAPAQPEPLGTEPAARRLLRVAFGCIWLFDGILQAQVSMPLGLPSGVLQPAASGSPGWVRSLVGVGATIWNNHPVPAAASAVWIQVGIGVWLLVAPRGNWSRAAGLASALWGLVVWVFGEAFGSILAPGLSWLFGAPGAVLFYVVAGVLIACPERIWFSRRLGRGILRASGLFFIGMAVLQAWPGRGFWQGQPDPHVTAGSLTSMLQGMAQTPQPGFLSSVVSGFASFDAAHGWAVNLFVVIALGLIGAAFLVAQRRIVLVAVVVATLLCLADWVLIEDLGFLGGVGTDPNSMIPMALIFISGYVAVERLPIAVEVGSESSAPEPLPSWRERLVARPAYLFRCLAAIGAIGVVLARRRPNGAGRDESCRRPHPQRGDQRHAERHQRSGASLRSRRPVRKGRVPGKPAGLRPRHHLPRPGLYHRLPPHRPGVSRSRPDARRRGSPCGLHRHRCEPHLPLGRRNSTLSTTTRDSSTSSNWRYLTGSLQELQRTWNNYGIETAVEPAGAMVAHSEIAYVIDPSGHTRYVMDADPGQGTASLKSSFAGLIAGEIRTVLAGP